MNINDIIYTSLIHISSASPSDSWSPVSSLDSVSSLHSGRNLGLVAALLGSLAILLAIAAYLATKYRAKQPAPVGIVTVTIYHFCSFHGFHLVEKILLFLFRFL